MIDAISISSNGLRANQAWIDSISDNIANIQTPNFKRTVVQFEDLVAVSSDDTVSSMNTQSGQGASALANSIDASMGQIKRTGDSLHIAINGGGFIEVIDANGESKYTRGGVLTVNADGQLLASGMEIASQVFLPPDASNIEITGNGVVRVGIGQDAGIVDVGQLELVQFSNPNMLTREGGGLFAVNESSGEPIFSVAGEQSVGQIMQGYLEMSNVELVDEMTSLVMAQRAYQLNARVIQTADQILETINNLRR